MEHSWRSRTAASFLTPATLLFLVASVAAAQSSPRSPEVLRDLPYVASPHPEQYLDFYWPGGDPRATVLFIHGGGLYEHGERRTSSPYRDTCAPFMAEAVGCATMDYRLAPEFSWPAMPEDVVSAIVKVRELVASRGGDPDRLFLFGHSSGCHLAAVVATNESYLQAVGLSTSNLAGTIPMGCTLDPYDIAVRELDLEVIRAAFQRDESDRERFGTAENRLAANPSLFVGSHVPPTLVVVAKQERFFPANLEQGARFVRRLKEANVPAELVIVPGKHMSSIADLDEPGNPTFRAISDFIADPAAATGF